MSQETVNTAVLDTLASVQKNFKNGQIIYKANVKWDGDTHCTAQVRKFEPLAIDEPASFGGADAAMSPVDLVLSALGSCQIIMYSVLASVMEIPIEDLQVDLKGDLDLRGLLGLDKQIPAGFTRIEYHAKITSPASSEQLSRLVNAVENQCPLLDMLIRPVEVVGKVTFNGTEEYKPA